MLKGSHWLTVESMCVVYPWTHPWCMCQLLSQLAICPVLFYNYIHHTNTIVSLIGRPVLLCPGVTTFIYISTVHMAF